MYKNNISDFFLNYSTMCTFKKIIVYLTCHARILGTHRESITYKSALKHYITPHLVDISTCEHAVLFHSSGPSAFIYFVICFIQFSLWISFKQGLVINLTCFTPYLGPFMLYLFNSLLQSQLKRVFHSFLVPADNFCNFQCLK